MNITFWASARLAMAAALSLSLTAVTVCAAEKSGGPAASASPIEHAAVQTSEQTLPVVRHAANETVEGETSAPEIELAGHACCRDDNACKSDGSGICPLDGDCCRRPWWSLNWLSRCKSDSGYADDSGHCKLCGGSGKGLSDRLLSPFTCLFGYIIPSGCCGEGCPPIGAYNRVYPLNPYYTHFSDQQVFGAQGYGVPVSVPLAPVVGRAYNYSWGLPASRLTPISNVTGYTTPTCRY